MELKFGVKDFSQIRKSLKENNARFLYRRKERYTYLKNGDKLTTYKGKYFYVTIKKKNNMFILKKTSITKNIYQSLLPNTKRILNNSKSVYKIGLIEISLNEMEVGKFVIIDGKNPIHLSKALQLKNQITKPFSEL
jgi:hypothetical protein